MNISILFLAVIIAMAAQQVNAKSLQNSVSRNESSTDVLENTSGKTNTSLNQNQNNGSLTGEYMRLNRRILIRVPLRHNCEGGQIQSTNGKCVDEFSNE